MTATGIALAALHDLDGHGAETAGAAPDQHRIVRLHLVFGPAVQHAIRGRADQDVGRGLFPVHVLGLRHALVRLDLGELGEAAVVGLVSPDPERRRVHRVVAGLDPRAVAAPHAAVDDDLVADLHVGDVLADLVDDARGIAAADVEILRLAGLVARLDDVDRDAERGPDVIVVDAGRHDVDEALVVRDVGDLDHFLLERLHGLTEPLPADQPGVHLLWNFTERRLLADLVDFFAHASPSASVPVPGVLSSTRHRKVHATTTTENG